MSEKLAELASSSVASLIKIDLFGGGGSGGGDKRHNKEPARPMTEVQVTGPETQRRHQQQAPAGQLHVDEAKSASAPTTADSSRKNDSSLLKPKTPSLLMRARNSTINLASLATVTNRFSCSASVGNLWHHGQQQQQQQQQQHNSASSGGGGDRHTAEPGEGGIQTLEYIRAGAFDSELPLGASETRPLAREPQSVKSASCHKLLGTTPSLGSGRKLSTKEKCKRQKEAERVEKLRLLVNYLKSGSGQPLVSPVALEADEIELAERYKLHMVLRDDLLANETAVSSNPSSTPIAVASGAGDPRKQQQQQAVSPSPTNVVAGAGGGQSMAAGLAIIGAAGDQHHQQHQHEHQHHPASHKGAGEGAAMGKGRMMISHSIGGTTASSPVSTSSGSMNHAHSTNDGRSIPHIGNVTWVLRHSISDPGNNFEHSPAFSSSSSSHNHHHHHHHHHPAHDLHNNHHHHHHHHHHQHHHHHHNQSDMHANGSENIHNHSSNPFGLPEGSQHNNQSECLNCESCAPSSSYSGASLNNYCSAPAINKEAPPMQPTTSSGGPPKTPQAGLPAPFAPPAQPPKLFYIDDMDPLPTVAALPNGPTLAPTTSTPTIATTPAQPLLPPPLSASSVAVCSADRPSTCCSQPVTPAISTTSCGIGERNNSSSASTSAWSNAPNLASWIDNEVNSLVHDLEAKSQELSGGKGAGGDSKQAKGGKKKWLSVASGNTRRNSSGAQST